MDNTSDPIDEAIEVALEGRPRATHLDQLIAALEVRRDTYARERDGAKPDRRPGWDSRIREVEEQIRVLREERAITGFVEDSVRFSVNRERIGDEVDEFPE